MKKIIVSLFLLSTVLLSQEAGKTGLAFLKHPSGARNAALADLGVVLSNDVSSFNYNPALLTGLKKEQITVSHNQLLQDITSQAVGASMPVWGIPLALYANNTTIPNIEIRNLPGDALSTFNAHYFYLSLSSAFMAFEGISAGVNIKYIYEGLYTDNSQGYAFDFGLSKPMLDDKLLIGLSLRNIGSMDELRNEATKLPADLRLGASWNYALHDYDLSFLFLGGYHYYFESAVNSPAFALEAVYKSLLAVRAGLQPGLDTRNFSGGVGFFYSDINFDYSYSPYSEGLGTGHIISLRYTFN